MKLVLNLDDDEITALLELTSLFKPLSTGSYSWESDELSSVHNKLKNAVNNYPTDEHCDVVDYSLQQVINFIYNNDTTHEEIQELCIKLTGKLTEASLTVASAASDVARWGAYADIESQEKLGLGSDIIKYNNESMNMLKLK